MSDDRFGRHGGHGGPTLQDRQDHHAHHGVTGTGTWSVREVGHWVWWAMAAKPPAKSIFREGEELQGFD